MDSYPSSEEDDLDIHDILKSMDEYSNSIELESLNASLNLYLQCQTELKLEFWKDLDFTRWSALNVRALQSKQFITDLEQENNPIAEFKKYLQETIREKTERAKKFRELNSTPPPTSEDTILEKKEDVEVPTLINRNWGIWNAMRNSRSVKWIGGTTVVCLGLVYFWNHSESQQGMA